MARKPVAASADRTPIAEWVAAALGLILTLAVIGYTLWEGVAADPGPPRLTALARPAVAGPSGFIVPIVVRNDSDATAAQVEVRGVLTRGVQPPEERRASFAYVPGRGEVRGGLVFQQDPAKTGLSLSVEGFADP